MTDGAGRPIGGGLPALCLLASVWTALHVVLGHVVATCTMGNDKSWITGAVVSAPTMLVTWFFLLRMTRLGLTPDGRATALIALSLTNILLLPTLWFGLQDARNLFLAGGALCGPDFKDYAPELSDLGYWATRSLIVLYFNAVPLLTLALSAMALQQNERRAAPAADEV